MSCQVIDSYLFDGYWYGNYWKTHAFPIRNVRLSFLRSPGLLGTSMVPVGVGRKRKPPAPPPGPPPPLSDSEDEQGKVPCVNIFSNIRYGMFTLPDTETDTETDKIWVVENRVEVVILHIGRHQHRFPLSPVSFSVSGSINAPLPFTLGDIIQYSRRPILTPRAMYLGELYYQCPCNIQPV